MLAYPHYSDNEAVVQVTGGHTVLQAELERDTDSLKKEVNSLCMLKCGVSLGRNLSPYDHQHEA